MRHQTREKRHEGMWDVWGGEPTQPTRPTRPTRPTTSERTNRSDTVKALDALEVAERPPAADEARDRMHAALRFAANCGLITLFTADSLIERHWRKLLQQPTNTRPLCQPLAVWLPCDAATYEPDPEGDRREPLPPGVRGVILAPESIFQDASAANATPVALAADAILLIARMRQAALARGDFACPGALALARGSGSALSGPLTVTGPRGPRDYSAILPLRPAQLLPSAVGS